MKDSIIDEELLTWFEIMEEIGIVDGNSGSESMGIDAENESIAYFEVAGGADSACANGGSLGIEEQGNFLTPTSGKGAQSGGDLPDEIVAGVRHVEAKDIGPAVEKGREGRRIGMLRSKGGDEFGSTREGQFPHRRGWDGCS